MARSRKHKKEQRADTGSGPAAEPAPEETPAAMPAASPEGAPAAGAEADRERLLRLQADFDNFKKRTIRDRAETYRRANEDIMEELLPVMDHMELAMQAAAQHDADQAIVEGFRLVAEQLRSALGKFGLTEIDATGAEFDPNLHEAISHMPAPGVPENHVMTMTRRGYKLGDMLLRAAQVVVSSGDPTAPAEDAVAPDAAGAESGEASEV